nr:uncharacterized protein LOC126516841 [Dermacentor andersoni]
MEVEKSTEKEQRAQSSSSAVQEQLCAPPRTFDEESDNNSQIVVQEAQMDEEEEASSLYANERAKWLRKEREMKRKIERVQKTVDRYKSELEKVKEDCNFADMSYIRQQAKQKDTSAVFLWNQIINFRRKKPTWSEDVVRHCIILRHLSTKAYEHARKEGLLKLPGRTTLQEFLGGMSGEAGFNSLIKLRLKAEIEKLTSPASRHCSLIMDEMRIKPKLQYNKQQDCFVGHADVGEVNDPANEPLLANSLLCFLINGLSTSYRIPVSYFFTKNLSGSQLSQLVRSVIKNVEESGFKVDRLVADKHKINVSAMRDLCGGFLTYRIEHPVYPDRPLFLSFDCCHVLKNVRSQFLEREIGPDGEISSRYLKIYDLQKELIVKPVRKLTRKHVFPNNIEKMNVKRALEIFSPSVTAALEFLRGQAGHSCDYSFAAAGPTITFMKNIYRWFILHDTSNTAQYIHQNNPDVRHYDDSDDSRLEWLELTFPMYVEELKNRSPSAHNFLTAETYEALLLTTYSTVACVRHLLAKEKFCFVLTRKFNSDPIESLFGTLRRSLGSNDQLDVRSAMSGLEKLLKTGIVAVPECSNILHEQELVQSKALPAAVRTRKEQSILPSAAIHILERFNVQTVPTSLPTLQVTATVYMGGYIARVVREHMECYNCGELTSKVPSSQPLQQLTKNQDRGGLLDPSDELLYVLETLRMFINSALTETPNLRRPLASLLNVAVPALIHSALLRCTMGDDQHRQKLVELVCSRFMKPLLSNYASAVTDKSDVCKNFARKPLSRKYLKL